MCPRQETKPIGQHTRFTFVSGLGTGPTAVGGAQGPETTDKQHPNGRGAKEASGTP